MQWVTCKSRQKPARSSLHETYNSRHFAAALFYRKDDTTVIISLTLIASNFSRDGIAVICTAESVSFYM